MEEDKKDQESPEVPEPETNKKKIEVTEHEESDEKVEESADTQVESTEVKPEEQQTEDTENDEPEEEQSEEAEVKAEQADSSVEDVPEVTEEETEQSDESNSDENQESAGQEEPESEKVEEENSDVADTDEDSANSEPDEEKELDTSKTIDEAIEESEKSEELTDEEIDKVVDDIVRSESDEAIAEADAKLEALKEKKEKKTFRQKITAVTRAWWENKPIRYGTFAGLAILLAVVALLPTTRYAALNLFGVRVSSSMTVIDSQTRLPLKNINVELQNESSTTNEDGYVEFTSLKLGNSNLKISKIGYADNERTIVLGWGSNPIGEQELLATGEQFTFVLADWQSGVAITNAEASAGENSAKANDEGKIVLTVGQKNISEVEIVIDAENYRQETFTISELSDEEVQVKMVPSKKHAFVSNRSGQYDLYKIDLDKQNEEVLLASTGKEREVPVVLVHPTRNILAFVSSRDGDENADGFILDGLFIINADTGETKRIARSEQLQLLGWSGDTLVFWQVVEGTSRANPERSKIIAYDERTSERTDLAAANYFNDIELYGDKVFYAVSSYAVPQSQAKLYSVDISGENQAKLIDKQVWSIYRTAFSTLIFNSEDQKWYEKVDDGLINEIGQQPAPTPLEFKNAPNGETTAWVEVRDGKGVLLISNTDQIQEQQILSAPGLSEVLYWINDTSMVYRVITNTETADYLIDITNKEPIKITDVSATQNRYF